MTELIIHNSDRLEKFFEQNQAIVEDAIDGVLLDNFLAYGKRGVLVVLENPVNTNQSNYRVFFGKYGTEDARKVVRKYETVADAINRML